ncbi:MAG: HAMP domain-containing histidine kinase [Nitrospiraceae bacterium]|nr:MAG: HAMP domain-containing histidine kinase [Nitrospiraceae bacterium]
MTLKKKIFLSSFANLITISILITAGYINLIEIKKEIGFLELSDDLRSQSLQLRRHEKNFFLYRDREEIRKVYNYLSELREVVSNSRVSYSKENLLDLELGIEEYTLIFKRIESIDGIFKNEFDEIRPLLLQNPPLLQIAETTYLEAPLVLADILAKHFPLNKGSPVIESLHELNTQIMALRKSGEDILNASNALDISARKHVGKHIKFLNTAAILLFPVILLIALGTSLIINHDILSRLKILTQAIEKTGKGEFSSLPIPAKEDEVGELIIKMENGLITRDKEIRKKNEELLLSKKLASLGTLASGVAHELNNPLNNVYLAAQTLSRKLNLDECPDIVNDSLNDVFVQTQRMKRIVSDLLLYSRQRVPELELINIVKFMEDLFWNLDSKGMMADVKYNIRGNKNIRVCTDSSLLQQVLINLCTNAVDAMGGDGTIEVTTREAQSHVDILLSDTGKGIPAEVIPKIFDPFFSTKDNGTGLGLTIVYSIIESLSGKIYVESAPDKGTTFSISLPGEKCLLKS